MLVGSIGIGFLVGALGINPSPPRSTYSPSSNRSTDDDACRGIPGLAIPASVGSRYQLVCGLRFRSTEGAGAKLCVSAPTTSVTPAGLLVVGGHAIPMRGTGNEVPVPGVGETTSYGTLDMNFGRVMAPGSIVVQFAREGAGAAIIEDGSQCEVSVY